MFNSLKTIIQTYLTIFFKLKKLTFKLILVIYCVFNCVQTHAGSECSNTRLDQHNGPLANIPIYDQDSFGSCYAYVAAQLIDAFRVSHKLPNPKSLTSPVKLTTDTMDSNAEQGGGYIEKAIENAKYYGSCNKKVTDQLLSKLNEKEFYAQTLSHYRHYLKEQERQSMFKKLTNTILGNDFSALQSIRCNLQNTGLSKNLLPSLADLDKIIKESYKWENIYLKNLISNICKNDTLDLSNLPNPISEYITHKPWDAQERANQTQIVLNRLLTEKNAQPVGITFCGITLTNPLYNGHPYNTDECKRHAAIIVGSKKTSDGSCMYLMRNAFGTGCELPRRFGLECEDGTGQIWLKGDRIGKATLGLTILK